MYYWEPGTGTVNPKETVIPWMASQTTWEVRTQTPNRKAAHLPIVNDNEWLRQAGGVRGQKRPCKGERIPGEGLQAGCTVGRGPERARRYYPGSATPWVWSRLWASFLNRPSYKLPQVWLWQLNGNYKRHLGHKVAARIKFINIHKVSMTVSDNSKDCLSICYY